MLSSSNKTLCIITIKLRPLSAGSFDRWRDSMFVNGGEKMPAYAYFLSLTLSSRKWQAHIYMAARLWTHLVYVLQRTVSSLKLESLNAALFFHFLAFSCLFSRSLAFSLLQSLAFSLPQLIISTSTARRVEWHFSADSFINALSVVRSTAAVQDQRTLSELAWTNFVLFCIMFTIDFLYRVLSIFQ